MASVRVLTCQARVVAYLPSLRSAVRHFRAFSSPNTHITGSPVPGSTVGGDMHFPMPGMQGLVPSTHRPSMVGSTEASPRQQPLAEGTLLPDLLTECNTSERHLRTLGQYITAAQSMPEKEMVENDRMVLPTSVDNLECVALDCPQALRKDFSDLFPERDLATSGLTVITISQKTKNDMSVWNREVEQERETLLEQGAQDICVALKEAGFWADFVDPSSGRPFYGCYTNATLLETDDRYKELGFEIEDLGCCRVISHHLWGKHAYVGCLFTDAPANHPVFADLMKGPNYQ